MSQSILYNDRIEIIQYEAEIDVLNPPVSKDFIALQKKLLAPGYDEDNYRRFIDLVGTHVVKKSSFGGKMDHDVVIENYYATFASSESISANINVQWNEFQFGAGANGTNSDSYKVFQNRSFASVSFLGGNYEWAQPDVNSYNMWYASIAESPAMLFFEELVEITEFVSDALSKQNLKKFLGNYYAQASKIIPSSKTTLKLEATVSSPNAPFCDAGKLNILAGFPDREDGYWVWDTDYDQPIMPSSCVYDSSGSFTVVLGDKKYRKPMDEGCGGSGVVSDLWYDAEGYFVTNNEDNSVVCVSLNLVPKNKI